MATTYSTETTMKNIVITISLLGFLTAPTWAAEDFTSTKEVRLIHGDVGSPKAKTVVITEKAKIDKLLSTIKLEKKVPCACDHIQHAVFIKEKGEVTVSLCDHCFDIGTKTYVMPPEFYKLYMAYSQKDPAPPAVAVKLVDENKAATAEVVVRGTLVGDSTGPGRGGWPTYTLTVSHVFKTPKDVRIEIGQKLTVKTIKELKGAITLYLVFDKDQKLYRLQDPFGERGFSHVDVGAAARGRQFLVGLLDPSTNLLPEFRGSKTYWLYHDNYLAAKVLQKSHPEVAQKIAEAMDGYGVKESGKIEILFGESSRPLPFRHFQLREVKQIGNKLIKTETVTDKEMNGWEEYADLSFLAALAEKEPATARQFFLRGMAMWDGIGFHDRAAQASGIYATYKLALALVTAARLGEHPEAHATIMKRLLAQQAKNGGWITDYDRDGKPVGVANVETTSLAILAVEAANKVTGSGHD